MASGLAVTGTDVIQPVASCKASRGTSERGDWPESSVSELRPALVLMRGRASKARGIGRVAHDAACEEHDKTRLDRRRGRRRAQRHQQDPDRSRSRKGVTEVRFRPSHAFRMSAALAPGLLLAVGLPGPSQDALAVTQTQVSASGGWVNTHVTVAAGDQLAISASGSWTADGAAFIGPDGYSEPWPDNFLNLSDLGACSFCATTPAARWGALVGYVGAAPPAVGSYTSDSVRPSAERVFVVGSNFRATTPATGELWLAFNDDAYSGYTADNLGSVSASVTVSNPPPTGEAITQRVLLFVYDPILENRGSQRLHAAYGWEDPVSLTNKIVTQLESDSHGIVTFNVVDTQA